MSDNGDTLAESNSLGEVKNKFGDKNANGVHSVKSSDHTTSNHPPSTAK